MRKYSDGATLCEVLDYKERRKSDYCIREVEGSKREMMMTRHNSLERSHDVSRRQMTGAVAGLGPLQLMYRDNRDCQRPKTGGQCPQCPELCLSLSLAGGYLQVHVMAARIVPQLPSGLPDTYVKTCLKEDQRRFLKKKSRVVCSTTDPFYNHRVKFLSSDLPRR